MSFNPYAFFSQPLLLTLAQILGVVPQVEIPTTTTIPETNGLHLSQTQKAALIGLFGSLGLISTGAIIAADKLSTTRIEIVEHQEPPKGTIHKFEEFIKRNKKELTTLGALLLLGGATAIYSQLPQQDTLPIDTSTVQPLATGQWYTTLGGIKAEP